MAVCLKKVRGLKKVEKIVDCQWLWSEPHSRRVKLRLTVQKDVLGGRAGMQQSIVIEGIIQGTQCEECKKVLSFSLVSSFLIYGGIQAPSIRTTFFFFPFPSYLCALHLK